MTDVNFKILITDDDPDVRELLIEAVRDWGYTAVVAKDGEDALVKLRMERYNIVVTDLMMPKMDGLVLLQRIKELDRDIQVIMITGYATIETAVNAIQAGAYDYIAKPFRLDELMIVIKKACEWIRLMAQNKELLDELHSAHAEIAQLKAALAESANNSAAAGIGAQTGRATAAPGKDSPDLFKQQEYVKEADRLLKNKFALKV
ncbi:MAG: sigma-54-dependent Fis family transcriptional regulator [Deltaproteobacteria bacterium]|nr:sigma-54-dependent Fis family transcriptional regulator [Deltaproteobacteria bacterium]